MTAALIFFITKVLCPASPPRSPPAAATRAHSPPVFRPVPDRARVDHLRKCIALGARCGSAAHLGGGQPDPRPVLAWEQPARRSLGPAGRLLRRVEQGLAQLLGRGGGPADHHRDRPRCLGTDLSPAGCEFEPAPTSPE